MNVGSPTKLVRYYRLKRLIKTFLEIFIYQNNLLFSCEWVLVYSSCMEVEVDDYGKAWEECESAECPPIEPGVECLDEWRGSTKGLKFPFVFSTLLRISLIYCSSIIFFLNLIYSCFCSLSICSLLKLSSCFEDENITACLKPTLPVNIILKMILLWLIIKIILNNKHLI